MMRAKKIYQKGSGRMNEDHLLVKHNTFAVFDGVTSLVPFIDRNGKTGGRLAAEIAEKTFEMDTRKFSAVAAHANKNIYQAMQKAGVDTRNIFSRWAVAVAAVRIAPTAIEIFSIADCNIMAFKKDGSYALLTKYVDHDREFFMQWKRLGQRKIKNIHEVLAAQIKKVRARANLDYGALNGDNRAVKFFYTAEILRAGIVALLLFTDGLLLPKKDPRAPEDWKRFVALYRKGGLRGLARYVRRLEKSDPYCWKYPRYKKHDDIAAISIDL